MHALILAGGFATRLWPLTEKRAKPLLPLAGKPIISHLVEHIPQHIPVTVSTNAIFADGFATWRADFLSANHERSIEIIMEHTKSDDEKLGALGAVAQWIAEEKIDDDLLLLTGDNYVGFSIEEFICQYQEKPKYNGKPFLALHDIGKKEKAKGFGTVMTDGHGKVTGFEEKPQEPKTTNVSTGIYVLPKRCLNELIKYAKEKPDNVGGIFEHFLSENIEVMCLAFNEPWFDIGSFETYIEATKALVGENVHTEEGATVEGSDCNGSVVVGARSYVKNCTLTDTVIFEECTIEDCTLERCIVDRSCNLRGIDISGKMLKESTTMQNK